MKKIITIIVVILVILLAFWYLGTSNTANTTGDSSLTASQSTSESTDAQYIYSLLQQMGQVKLDDSIFSDPSFESLKDNTVSFSAEPAGRANPFAPVGSTDAPASTTTINVSLK